MQITPEIVRELLSYDPHTGIFTWLKRGEHWFKDRRAWKIWNTRQSGRRAGSVWTSPENGYQKRLIRLLNQNHREHQLAWMWMTDDPLPEEIDHENRDATDNRWSNLRASTHTKNMHNRSMNRNNTSGVTGVNWFKPTGKWVARCMINGKSHFLGQFDEIDEATMEVMEFRGEHGFDQNHGAELAHYCR